MRRRICALLVVSVAMMQSGCGPVITARGTYGAGPSAGAIRERAPDSTGIYLPLNLSLRAKDTTYDLRQHVGGVSAARINEFFSIGIRAISAEYGFAATAWTNEFNQDTSPSPEADIVARTLGVPSRPTPLDYKLTARLSSPTSQRFSRAGATTGQGALINVDSKHSPQLEYQAMFSGSVAVSLRSEIRNALFFDVDLTVRLEKKSGFAADKHFARFTSIDRNAVDRLRELLGSKLLEAYATALNEYGFDVEKRQR